MDIAESTAFGSYYHTDNKNNLYIRNNTVLDNSNIDLLCNECKGITVHLKSSTIVDDIFVKYQFDELVDHTKEYPIRINQPQPEFLVECPCCKKETNHFICDTELSYAISQLNQKGYMTKFCCSGHNEYDPNIIFANFYKFDSKPIYWKAIYDRFEKRSRVILRLKKKYRNAEHITKAFQELNRWVYDLPESLEFYIRNYTNAIIKNNGEFDGDTICLIDVVGSSKKVDNESKSPTIAIRDAKEIKNKIDVLEKHIKDYYSNEKHIVGQENIIAEMQIKVETLNWVLMQEIELIPKEMYNMIKNPSLRTILDSNKSFAGGVIKKAINAALKKEDNGGYNYTFLQELREFNLKHFVGPNKVDLTSRYKLNLRGGFYVDLVKIITLEDEE